MPAVRPSKASGLALRAIVAFVASFVLARTFTTFYPDVVVASGGIHFHHFWYGLAMVLIAGWLGIASNRPELDRLYAFVFGVGSGLVGDEVGLLLTFGDYRSLLTYEFFLVALSLSSIGLIVMKYWSELKEDLSTPRMGERLMIAGVVTTSLSALPLSFGLVIVGWSLFGLGAATSVVGAFIHWRFLSAQ